MLSIKDLNIAFKTRRGEVNAVKGISFELAKGERLGIVGESGSGKSVTSYALMRILDAGGTDQGWRSRLRRHRPETGVGARHA